MDYLESSFYSINSSSYHKIVYSDWAPENEKTIICVHGLTGNGHDFDWLAPALVEKGYRVIAVDIAGRGRSDFLPDEKDYHYGTYLRDLIALMARLNISQDNPADWIGISMGGLLGIRLAGLADAPLRTLILNDIGPHVPQSDLDFISSFVGRQYEFETVEEMEHFMRQTRGLSYEPLDDETWAQIAKNNARLLDNGKITYSYDPRIAPVFAKEPVGSKDLWACWDKIAAPVLALRGSKSTIFPQDVAEDMAHRGPGANGLYDLKIIEGCGHVPSLTTTPQIKLITDWLTDRTDSV